MEKLVSVCINVYNGEKFILEAVNSVLGQTYKNIQLIVVDDSSTDNTYDILKSVADSRIEIHRNNANMHMTYSCNRALDEAKGDYIAHLDADDLWLPHKLEKQVAFLEEHPEYGACFTHADIIDENGMPANDRFQVMKDVFSSKNMSHAEMFRFFVDHANHLCHGTLLVRRDILNSIGRYNSSHLYLQDYECWMRLMAHSPIYILQEPLALARMHGNNNSTMNKQQFIVHDVELMRTIKTAINTCPDELFLEAFSDKLRIKGPHTHQEVELEKAFFLIDGVNRFRDNPVLAIEKFAELFKDDRYVELALEKFGFSTRDFYRLEETPAYLNQAITEEISEKINEYKEETAQITEKLNKANQENERLVELTKKQKTQLFEAEQRHIAEAAQVNYLNSVVTDMRNSFFWRITAPFRKLSQSTKDIISKNRRVLNLCIVGKCLLRKGPKAAKQKYLQLYKTTEMLSPKDNKISKERRSNEEKRKFDKTIKFSILVPLYNTPQEFLTEMIESVLNQTYKNWELCLADGSDKEHEFVKNYCLNLAKKDKRIVYKQLETNGGISENTNACIEMSSGDYIALFDHDDVLHPSALYKYMEVICDRDADFIYCDEDKFSKLGQGFYDQYFKPDFAPDNLRANNYICHFTVFKKTLLEKTGGFRKAFDGSQDHDLVLRLTEQAENIVHIHEILYHWRISDASVASDPYAKPYTIEAGKNAVREHLSRVGLKGTVESLPIHPNMYRIRYEIKGEPLVSILIPNYNHADDLDKCLMSIINKSTYKNYEIIIIENNSNEETFKYYETLKKYPQIKVVVYKTDKFNYSAINNFGVKYANGEHLIFLNNDVEIISDNWIEEMLMFSQREDVGIVGAKLYFEDDTIQHAGVVLGIGGVAGHIYSGHPRSTPGYFGKAVMANNYSIVTFACAMMKRSVFDEVEGLDETFEVAFNDVDICMRVREAGYLNCWTPFAELYHYESKSRGSDTEGEKQIRFMGEIKRFRDRWEKELEAGDPYYNKNLTLIGYDHSPKRPEEL